MQLLGVEEEPAEAAKEVDAKLEEVKPIVVARNDG